jgi:hypothetical protein
VEISARDTTEEWKLPKGAVPPTVAELEARIDEAVAIARASEAAAMVVGAAAIDSAEQARRAADLALRASETATRSVAPTNGARAAGRTAAVEDERMVRFSRRADLLGARFAQLQRR